MACVSVQPAVAQGSLRLHLVIMRCAALSTAKYFRVCALQKANLFCNASKNDTRTVITLGHAATNGHSAWTPSVHNKDDRCQKPEHVSFVAVHRGCAHLLLNHLTSIALTASAYALAPSSPIWFFLRFSLVIDWLALSCFKLWSPYLNLVSHGDQIDDCTEEERSALCRPN